MRTFCFLSFLALSISSCGSNNGSSNSGAVQGASGIYAFPFSGLVDFGTPIKRNIIDFEFEIEDIVAVNNKEEVKAILTPNLKRRHNLHDHLSDQDAIEKVWIPSGSYEYLEIRLKKWPVAILEMDGGEQIRVISKSIRRVLDRSSFTSRGEFFSIQLYTDQPFPLTTENGKNIFARTKKNDSSGITLASSQLSQCNYFAAIPSKGTFSSFDEALSNASPRDIILLGHQAHGARLHISQANDVAITTDCDVTVDSIHLQKSKNLVFSKLAVMPSLPDYHAVMLQGSQSLNDNIIISDLKVYGEKGGVDGIHVGPHNKNVKIISSTITGFSGSGIDIHKLNENIEIIGNKIWENSAYGLAVDKGVGSNVLISNNRIERNGITGVSLSEDLRVVVEFNTIVDNGQSGSGYGVYVVGHKPEEVIADEYFLSSNTIIGNRGTAVSGKSTANLGNYDLFMTINDKNNIVESEAIPQTIDSDMLGQQEKFLFSDDNVRITLPLSASSNAADISVRSLATQEISGVDADTLIPGMAYEFGPSGKTFETPVEVMFEYDDEILASLGISDPSKVYLKEFDPNSNTWKLTSTIHDEEAKVIIGYIFHFSTYAYGFSDPRWPAHDPSTVPRQPLRFPVNDARPKILEDRYEGSAADRIAMDYPWAQAPNGCSVVGSAVPQMFPDFAEVCNRHDRCYYTFRTQSWSVEALSRDAWNSCNQNYTADLLKTCNPFYTRKKIKVKTVRDVLGTIVEVFKTVLVKNATSIACVYSARTLATAVNSGAVGPLCPDGGCYVAAQKKQLFYQQWLEKVVRQPHCMVTGKPDQLTLTIDSWDQPEFHDVDPYFKLEDGLNSPGVAFAQVSYNQWQGTIDRLGEFNFKVRNLFTDETSVCGVVISELPPELLPFGYIDVISAIGGCPPEYEQLSGDLNEGAGGDYIYFCGKSDKSVKMVTDVQIVGGPAGADCPNGYTKDHLDLNNGAGGWYIFLCKNIDSVLDGTIKPLTSLYTYASRDFGNQCADDHQWIDFDLNVGAGGRYIYLCKK
ncbi:right-handed parallel beta-helix repeat-containing protein [Oligoflexus tunisiensis]|uniref:right-handed parallel beta-helix repeat-containing protein n=1 Tax=Oligoflexus tunisiensis TaxID=708132 RepID=UPI00159F017D|nr:right-handed parallel beta-helix repeat-containing protein [Oligoflexus tunisiensis]